MLMLGMAEQLHFCSFFVFTLMQSVENINTCVLSNW